MIVVCFLFVFFEFELFLAHPSLRSCWEHFGIVLGSCWGTAEIVVGALCDHVGIVFGSCWDRLVCDQCGYHFVVKLRSFWDHCEIIFGIMLGSGWDHF